MVDVEYTDVEAVTALVRTASCPHDQLGPTITRLFDELTKANPDTMCEEPPMVVYRAWRGTDSDIEAAFPVDPSTVPGPGSELRTYPACTAVFTTFTGPYSDLWKAWTELWQYVGQNNVDVDPDGAPWDSYVKPPDDDAHPETAVTELYIPMR